MDKKWSEQSTIVKHYEDILDEVDIVTKKYKDKIMKILDDDDKQSYRQLVYQKELSQLATAYSNLTRIKMDSINEISKLTIKKNEENQENEIDQIYKELIAKFSGSIEQTNEPTLLKEEINENE